MGSNAKAILSVFNLKLILILVETVLVFFLYEKYLRIQGIKMALKPVL